MPILVSASEEVTLFPALRLDDIGDGAHENAAANGLFEDFPEVDASFVEVFRTVVEILRVDEYADTLRWMFNNCHESYSVARSRRIGRNLFFSHSLGSKNKCL